MTNEERKEFEDIQYLITTPEWRSFAKFLVERKERLKDKVLNQIRARKFEEAAITVGVLDDIERQVPAFKDRLEELTEAEKSQ